MKSKKLLAISGSPRKAATYRALEIAVEEIRKKGIQVDIWDFVNKKFNLCIDCGRCLKEESLECVLHDDAITGWASRFVDYDGYLIASPVYDVNITAQLQGFFNRMRSNWLLLEKNPYAYSSKMGAAIAVGGSRYGGQELVLNAINNYYLSLGIKVVSGGPFAYVGAGVWSKDQKAEGVDLDTEGVQSLRALGASVAKAMQE